MSTVYTYAIKLTKGQKMSVSTNSSVVECLYVVEVEDAYGRSYSRVLPESQAEALTEGSDYFHSGCCPCGWLEHSNCDYCGKA